MGERKLNKKTVGNGGGGRIYVSMVVQARAAGSGLIAKLTLIIGTPSLPWTFPFSSGRLVLADGNVAG